MKRPKLHPDTLAAWGLFAGLSLAYWGGRSLSFGGGDSPQHVISSMLWGVSWPPGYPLYNMLGFCFSKLPGPPEGAVNGMSGLFHAGTAALLYLTWRRLEVGRTAALAAALLMSLSPLYWYYSEVAEVRALNDFFAAYAAYWALRWNQFRSPLAWGALGAGLGLGLSHHPTFPMILPAVGYLLWTSRPKPRAKQILVLAGLTAFFCALPYIILGVRLAWPCRYNPTEVSTWSDIWALFTRKNLGGPLRMVGGRGFLDFGGFDWGRLIEQILWMTKSALNELTPPGILLAMIGGYQSFKRNHRIGSFWGLWLAVSAGVFVLISSQQVLLHDKGYAQAIVARFYLLAFMALFSFAAFGADFLIRRSRPWLGWALLAAAASPLLLRPISLKGRDPLLEYSRELVKTAGPKDIVLVAADDTILATAYLDLLRGETGDRVLLNPVLFSYDAYARGLKRRHPGLNLPPFGPQGLPMDWKLWLKLNPGRKLYAEAAYRDIMLKDFPHAVPTGILVEARDKPAAKNEPPLSASRFMESSLGRLSLYDIHPFTQELYLARTAAIMAGWHLEKLGPQEPELRSRLAERLRGL